MAKVALIIFIFVIQSVFCDIKSGCYLSSSDDGLIARIQSLSGKIFKANESGLEYQAAICTSVPENNENATIVVTNSSKPVIFGRRNRTVITGGDDWILLTYLGGDAYQDNETCKGYRSTLLLISCSANKVQDVLQVKLPSNSSCFLLLELQTSSICKSHQVPKSGLSRGSVFCIIFLSLSAGYLVIGGCYRRVMYGAKGFDQVPHADFWVRLGNLQADGCNFVCRKNDYREESWQRVSNNYTEPPEDRDDDLLRP